MYTKCSVSFQALICFSTCVLSPLSQRLCACLKLSLPQIHDTYYLVAIIDNDFVDSTLFAAFDEVLSAKAAQGKERRDAVADDIDDP